MNARRVGLTPRLLAALDMLSGSETVADVGSDHGKLAAALLQRGICRHVIATDISASSLEKAKILIGHIGLDSQTEFRTGNGLEVLKVGECDAIALLGMGGTLMCGILHAAETPLKGASFAVFQPMRAQSDIRSYLYRNGYHITDDRVIPEHGRYYQIFRAEHHDCPQKWPDGFPNGFFDVGYMSFQQKDEHLIALCSQQLRQHQKRMLTAVGTQGERKLAEKIAALEQILNALS